jgi:hypothetical protein
MKRLSIAAKAAIRDPKLHTVPLFLNVIGDLMRTRLDAAKARIQKRRRT